MSSTSQALQRVGRIRQGLAGATGGHPGDPLYRLDPRVIWRFLRRESAAFWCINIYLFFEYVRPQSIYEAIAGPPWAQLSLIATMGALFFERRKAKPGTVADATLLLFSCVLVISCITAFQPAISFGLISEYFAWVLIFLLISNIVVTEQRFLVFMLAFVLYNFKMSQHATRSWASAGFAFRDWGTTGAPGWFHNSGEFGIEMNVFLPIVVYFLIGLQAHWGWKLKALFGLIIATVVVGTIGSSSRGAMLGMAVVGLYLLAKSEHKLKGALALTALAALSFFLLPEESLDRFRSMGEDGTSVSRKIYWAAGLQAMREHPIFGIGYGNWTEYMRQVHGGLGLPHNIFIQAGAELGYIGLLAFIAMIIATFVVNYQTRKLLRPLRERGRFLSCMANGLDGALIGFMVSGSFVTVLYYPYFWINLAMTVALHNAARHTVKQVRKEARARQHLATQRTPLPIPAPGAAR